MSNEERRQLKAKGKEELTLEERVEIILSKKVKSFSKKQFSAHQPIRPGFATRRYNFPDSLPAAIE